MLLLLPLLTGVSAGLRSMTPLAIVAWASQHWPGVQQSSVAFMAAPAAAYMFTALAVAELIGDKLPFVPSRLTPGPLGARVVSGGLCGAVLCAAAQQSLAAGVLIGGIAGLAGSFAGFAARRYSRSTVSLPGFLVASGKTSARSRWQRWQFPASDGRGTSSHIPASKLSSGFIGRTRPVTLEMMAARSPSAPGSRSQPWCAPVPLAMPR